MKKTYFKTVTETKIIIGVIKTGGGWNLNEKDEYLTIPEDEFFYIEAEPTKNSHIIPNIRYVSLFYMNKEYRQHYEVIGRLVAMGFIVQCKGLNFVDLKTKMVVLENFDLREIEIAFGEESSSKGITFIEGEIIEVLYPDKDNCIFFYKDTQRLVSLFILFHLLNQEYIIF